MNFLFASPFVLAPLFFLSGFSNGFDLPKNFIIRSSIIAIIYGYGAFLMHQGALKINWERFRSPISIIFFLISGVFLLSTLFSPFFFQSFFGNYQRQFGFISWLFLAVLFTLLLFWLDHQKIKLFAKIMVITAGIISFYGLLQFLGFDFLLKSFNADIFEKRIYSTLGNPDFLAQYLSPLIPLTIAFCFEEKKRKWKMAFGGITGLLVVALLLTQSRAGVFGLMMGSIVLAIFLLYKKYISWKHLGIATAGLVLCATIIYATPLKNTPFFNRFNISATSFRSLESRFTIWDSAIKVIKDHPILGTGIDTFALTFSEHVEPKFFELEETLHTAADREHNELLQFGVWGGVPAMALYLALIAMAGILYFRQKKAVPIEQGIFISFFVFIGQNIFSFSNAAHYLMLIFLLGAIVVITQKNGPEKNYRVPKNLTFLILPLSCVCLLIWYFSAYIPLKVDRHYSDAVFGAVTQKELVADFEKAIALQPYSGFLHYELLMRDRPSMLPALEKLTIIEGETMNVLAWKANYYRKENFPLAKSYYEKALALNRKFLPILRAYADATFAHGDCEKAVDLYEEFLEYAPVFWRWKSQLTNLTPAQQKSYRIFYKNVPDFSTIFIRLRDCYKKLGNIEKSTFYHYYTYP